MSRYERIQRGGQQQAQTSIPPTTSPRPPRPVPQPGSSRLVNELRGRVMLLEEALVSCWQLWNDEVHNASYRDYLSECTSLEVEEILSRRPDILNQPPADSYDRARQGGAGSS